MGFDIKTWKDRDVQFPGRRTLTNIMDSSDFEDVVVERAEGTVQKQGDLYCASVMNNLEQRLANAFSELFTAITDEINTIYPVGSIYQSFNRTSPEELFPGTTWVAIVDKLLLAVETSDTSPENRGNAGHNVTINSYTNKQMTTSGTIVGTSLTEMQIPPHTHNYSVYTRRSQASDPREHGNGYSSSAIAYAHSGSGYTDGAGKGYAHSHGLSVSGTFTENPTVINIDQPYITMYAWRRTA